LKIGITGKNGFIGNHLVNTIKQLKKYKVIDFKRDFFNNENSLDKFISSCDVIVHLAGVNRHRDEEFLLNTNIDLSRKISDSISRVNFKKKLIFISSTHENSDTSYGISKLKSRELLIESSKSNGFNLTSLIVPNVFGPFCKPNYNSFIANFCNALVNNNKPKILNDNSVKLIYIQSLISVIFNEFDTPSNHEKFVKNEFKIKVSEVLKILQNFKKTYIENAEIPDISKQLNLNLFNTFRSYLDYNTFYPQLYKNNIDDRGNFIEVLRSNSQGQYSFSTTKPQVVRGNHYHTRKIERFAVISGEALIRMRKISSNEIIQYKLSGKTPSFVDIPLWHTHSIQNIGEEDLLTLFWINEPYNEQDSDTFFENV
jgi:UDP-2-acetamido-2,6-beta-L-arabino-hexul-4-ose reductase